MKKYLLAILVLVLALVISNSYAEISLSKGATGDDVIALQSALREQGYTITDPDGEFGNSTKNAVFMFQDDHGIIPSGEVDDETYRALFAAEEMASESETSQVDLYRRDEPYPGEVATAKSRLWVLGYDCGNTNGDIDDLFTEQILQFQHDSGLEQTGICDLATRNAIDAKANEPKLFPVLRESDSGALLFGLVNTEGEMVVPAKYERFEFGDGIYRMSNGFNQNDFYYQSGEEFEIPYDITQGGFEHGFCVVEDHGAGLINTSGEVVVPFVWGHAELHPDYGDSSWSVEKDGKYGAIDPMGNQIIDCVYPDPWLHALGEGWYNILGDKLINIYDSSLMVDYNDDWERMAVGIFSDGILYLRSSNNQIYMYNTKGEIAFPMIWDNIGARFNNGLDYVIKDGLYGYIDTSGTVVIDCQYEDATDFSEEYASVQLPGTDRYFIIDRSGNNPFPNVWSENIIMFHNGTAKIVQEGKVGFVNTQGEIIIPCEWDISEIETADYHDFYKDGYRAYSYMRPFFDFTGDLALVARNDKLYYINRDNEIIASAGPAVMIPTTPKENPPSAPSIDTSKSEAESEAECERIALDYLKDYLKNPESLQVHSTSSTKSGDEYTFIIDYSAMNSFGGYTRSKYICVVDSIKGEVITAYAN